MLGNSKHNHFDSAAVIATVILAAGIGAAQDFSAAVPSALTGGGADRADRFQWSPPAFEHGRHSGQGGSSDRCWRRRIRK
jgi:hypothetical protein